MKSMVKRVTLWGVVASAVLVTAATSVTMMTGGCGPYETIVCGPIDAGPRDSGQGGGDAGSTVKNLCDD